MAKCILHVGMHKTGTTSIQHSLQYLDDANFYYARMQDRPNHSLTISAIFHASDQAHIAKKLARAGRMTAAGLAELARPDLDASVAAANGRTLVLSGEGMVSMSKDELALLKDYLTGHGYDDIVVVAYVRPPAGYISSAMQQKLKAGRMRRMSIQACFPSYRKKFEKFDDAFGAGKVHLFKYDPEDFPDGDVVSDFCRRMEIPLGSVMPVRKNVSITRLAAQLRFQYTAHAEAEGLQPLRGGGAKRLYDVLRALDPTRFRLAPSAIAHFLPRIETDVRWMEERLGQSLAEPGLKDQDGDVRSTDDLLTPIPGINEKLRGLLIDAGANIRPGEAEDTWKLLWQLARIGAPDRDDGDSADPKAKRKALRRAARLLAGGGKEAAKSGRKLRQKGKLGMAAGADPKALRKARRSERQRETDGVTIGGGGNRSAGGEAGRRAGRGNGNRAGRGTARRAGVDTPTTKEERQRTRDERILALAQAIAAANAASTAATAYQPAPETGGGANRQGRGLGRGPGMGAGRQGLAGRQAPGLRAGHARKADATGQEAGQGLRPGKGAGMRAGQRVAGAGRLAKGAGGKGGAQMKPPKDVLQLPRANARPDAPKTARHEKLTPLTSAPTPLLNADKNFAVLWSPKSACTTIYVWFSHVSGFAEDVRDYSSWPHRHRQEQYMKSDLYHESAANGMDGAKLLRIIRDPYSRAVSIYRHALNTLFADKEMELYSKGTISAEKGYSFQTFLDMAATLDMRRANVHFRPQFHLYESQRKPDRVINISKQDLFAGLNTFEAELGITKTDFADLDWLHDLESKRKAKQEPMQGEAIDTMAFSRHQVNKLGLFPNYGQLLTPEARQKIELIYQSDFDAYREHL